jgi:hypothetical protein
MATIAQRPLGGGQRHQSQHSQNEYQGAVAASAGDNPAERSDGKCSRIFTLRSRSLCIWVVVMALCACSPALRAGSSDGPRGAGPGEAVTTGGAAACGIVPPPLGVMVTADLSVTSIVPAFGAARGGIQAGDVLVDIDGQPVDSVDTARRALDQAAARRVGACNDTIRTEVDPRTGRGVTATTPILAPTPESGVRVTVRRGERLVPLSIDLRWPAAGARRPTPPTVGGGNFSL